MCKITSEDNVADPLTKAIPPRLFDKHVAAMGIRYNRNCLEQVGEIVRVGARRAKFCYISL